MSLVEGMSYDPDSFFACDFHTRSECLNRSKETTKSNIKKQKKKNIKYLNQVCQSFDLVRSVVETSFAITSTPSSSSRGITPSFMASSASNVPN